MKLEEFINMHRRTLKRAIERVCPNIDGLDDEEIGEWIANDEGLYNWAKDEGVEV